MNDTLKDELCLYLGQLMHEFKNEFDWYLKDKIGSKINSINNLLDIDNFKPTWYEKISCHVDNMQLKKTKK